MIRRRYETHDETMRRLERKKRIAQMRLEERKIKFEILKLHIPILRFKVKFKKLIVLMCIVSIILYTIAAILLQYYTSTELSPTLTTAVYAFFGSELIGTAGISIFDKKYETANSSTTIADEDKNAVG